MGACALQGNKPMVEKIIVRALKSLSDNQVVINRDVWLKVGVPALSCLPCHYCTSDKSCRAPRSHTCHVISAPAQDVEGPRTLLPPMLKPQVWPSSWALGHCCDSCSWPISASELGGQSDPPVQRQKADTSAKGQVLAP